MFFTRLLAGVMFLAGIGGVALSVVWFLAADTTPKQILAGVFGLAGLIVGLGGAMLDTIISAILNARDEIISRLR